MHLTFFLLVTMSAPASPPPSLQQDSGCVEKFKTIILKCNLFRINWGRSVAFIYSYSSLTCTQFTLEISTRADLGPTKYPWEKISDPHEISTGKYLDLQNTHEKKSWTHELPTRRNFVPSKWHETHNGKRHRLPLLLFLILKCFYRYLSDLNFQQLECCNSVDCVVIGKMIIIMNLFSYSFVKRK